MYEHDIVDRLRSTGVNISESGAPIGYILSYVDAHEAADEIERLRARVEWLEVVTTYFELKDVSIFSVIGTWWREKRVRLNI
jgi:hypothetical protein